MAIFTDRSRISRALDFYAEHEDQHSIWWGIGGQTPWPTEKGIEQPQQPAITDKIDDIYAYKQNKSAWMVRPLREGESKTDEHVITYRGSYWKKIDPVDAYDEGARWVYLNTPLEYAEISTLATFRKLGIFTGFQTDVEGSVCLPDQVVNEGICEVLEYRKPVYRSDDQREILNVILEF